MDHSRFLVSSYAHKPVSGTTSWQAPSNIALVKYWGKYGAQLPMNPSISFTLNSCRTETKLSFEKLPPTESVGKKEFLFEVYLDGKLEKGFAPKIHNFFERVEAYLPFLREYTFKIETFNSFPHSSGIASSASGMAALALCMMDMERQMQPAMTDELFLEKASFLARLGSGSACRSIEGPLIVWGEHAHIPGSSNFFGTKLPFKAHPNFNNYQDTILLVDKGEKQVSSSVGHNLMQDHPFAEQRFKQAKDNLTKLIPVLKNGNLSEFIKIVEQEALSLHAMMMTSMPYFLLMKPNTLEIINSIWKFREATGSKICFTLDAGANVHVLYPESEKNIIVQFINDHLAKFCKNKSFITDQIGYGASTY